MQAFQDVSKYFTPIVAKLPNSLVTKGLVAFKMEAKKVVEQAAIETVSEILALIDERLKPKLLDLKAICKDYDSRVRGLGGVRRAGGLCAGLEDLAGRQD